MAEPIGRLAYFGATTDVPATGAERRGTYFVQLSICSLALNV